jgi:hypothetical protein
MEDSNLILFQNLYHELDGEFYVDPIEKVVQNIHI